MRTFSLIWSGIGCFATVAITVLGGITLANVNSTQAAGGYGFFLLVFDLEKCSHLNDASGLYFEGLELNPNTSRRYDGYPSGYYFTGVGVGDQFVLEVADFSSKSYYTHWGTFNVVLEDDYHKAIITITSANNLGSYYSYADLCFHIGAKEIEDVTVTAHISLDQ
jgi:hypothetical protein